MTWAMLLPQQKYKLADLPEDCMQYDQKAWPRLCKITSTGIADDGGSFVDSICVACSAQCSIGLPAHWRIAKLSGRSQHVTGEGNPMSTEELMHIGDILEALGGLVTWETAESR